MNNNLDANKISAEVITELAKTVSKSILEKLKKSYKDNINRNNIDYGIAFEEYLKTSRENIRMAKTILYGQTPRDLYSFFECMNIENKGTVIDTCNVNNIIEHGHKIIITGTGGIGKSMLMRHCFLNTIQNTQLIPVLVELRGLNDTNIEDLSIENYIYKTLKIFGFKLEEEYFKYSLETGCYLILFDGFDEVKNSISQKVTQEINDFSNQYNENYIIVSSRPSYEFIGWSDFVEYSAMPLTKEQALSLISKLDYDKDLKKKFIQRLDESLFEKYQSFASNPLLLTIMLLTFEERVSFPDNKTDFYEQAFATLFHKHDSMKRGKYKREILSGLGYEDFKKVFSYFCFRTFFKNKYEFTEQTVLENITRAKAKITSPISFHETDYLKDLTNAVCMLVHEGLNYRFSHRSFQEYFAAVYATQLSDDEQKKFIGAWLTEGDSRSTSDFLNILCDLQPERFLKNVLFGPLKDLYNMYKENHYSKDWFFKYMYNRVTVNDRDQKGERVYIYICNRYYHTILISMIHYRRCERDIHPFDDFYNNTTKKIANAIKAKNNGESIRIEELDSDLFEDLKAIYKWVLDEIDMVCDIVENFESNQFSRKRKFESMIDEL